MTEPSPERTLANKFRLFVSSTFSDFGKERDLLQQEVFPEVESFCARRGFQFQAIDLRWGVSQEAQYDQRTLDLCLDELRACQSYQQPNFLIMVGDRYGWIPLPSFIQRQKFLEILQHLPSPDDRRFLEEWYYFDSNQIPESYFLKRREGSFQDYQVWSNVENRLRNVLNQALQKNPDLFHRDLVISQSATEQEIQCGLDGYLELVLNEVLVPDEKLDQTAFAFIRSVEETAQSEYPKDDVLKTTRIKNALRTLLPNENVCEEENVSQTDLDAEQPMYLQTFKQRLLEHLTLRIAAVIDQRQAISEMRREVQGHQRYCNHKHSQFVGRSIDLEHIHRYIENHENRQPLFVVGASGQGKSSLLAALVTGSVLKHENVIFRFVGATPNSCDRNRLLESILNQMNGTTENAFNDQISYKKLCETMSEALLGLKGQYFIFIDALDQLIQEDHLLWLPHQLSENVKVIISLLNDPRYEVASKTHKNAKHRFDDSCFYEVSEYSDGRELLQQSLASRRRRVTETQMNFVLGYFKEPPTPLTLSLLVETMKTWTSTHVPEELPRDQLEATKRYINDISAIWHHHPMFVEKVLCCLVTSGEGLSESELLEFLSFDQDLVHEIAPDTFHQNVRGTIPNSVWCRLYDHCRPFLLKREHHGFEILQLDHREFQNAIAELFDLKLHQSALLGLIVLSIKKWESVEFSKTRVGMLFADVLVEHQLEYRNFELLETLCSDVIRATQSSWLSDLIAYLNQCASTFDFHFDKRALAVYEVLDTVYRLMPKEDRSSNVLADFYFRYGGYQYLHVDRRTGFNTLEKSRYHFSLCLEAAEPASDETIQICGALSQVLGRMGEILVREVKDKKTAISDDDLATPQMREQIQQAIQFYEESEPMLTKMLERDPTNLESSRKLGVLYERLALANQIIDDEKQMDKYFDLALDYKGRTYDPVTGRNGFTVRKLWIVMAQDRIDRGRIEEAKDLISRALDSVQDGELSKSVAEGNQYYVEQLFKVYTHAVALFEGKKEYEDELRKIEYYYRQRGIAPEY